MAHEANLPGPAVDLVRRLVVAVEAQRVILPLVVFLGAVTVAGDASRLGLVVLLVTALAARLHGAHPRRRVTVAALEAHLLHMIRVGEISC